MRPRWCVRCTNRARRVGPSPYARRSRESGGAMTDLVVTMVGTGIGGTEMAGYLGLHDARVRVHDVRKEAVSGIHDRGGLEVSGIASGFAAVERATTDLAHAVEGAALIAVTTLNNDHQAVARQLAPLLQDGQ